MSAFIPCPACAVDTPADGKFCIDCGASLADPPATTGPTQRLALDPLVDLGEGTYTVFTAATRPHQVIDGYTLVNLPDGACALFDRHYYLLGIYSSLLEAAAAVPNLNAPQERAAGEPLDHREARVEKRRIASSPAFRRSAERLADASVPLAVRARVFQRILRALERGEPGEADALMEPYPPEPRRPLGFLHGEPVYDPDAKTLSDPAFVPAADPYLMSAERQTFSRSKESATCE
jgi:hypothetical protein